MSLCIAKRGGELTIKFTLTTDRVELTFEMPLGEIVFDFYDKLKSISKGYASFDYSPIEYRESVLSKLDILLNGDPVDALSALVHKTNSYTLGKKLCEKLKELIPRQQFDIAIQSAIGSKIISRETVKALRKRCNCKVLWRRYYKKKKTTRKAEKRQKKNATSREC